MTQTSRRSIALVALVVFSVVGAGFAGTAAAAFGSYSITPTDDRAGITTTHDHAISAGAAGTLEDVVIDYDSTDVSGVAASDVTVTVAGTSQTVASVQASQQGTRLRITLSSTASVSSGDAIDVSVANVVNPDTSGSYTVATDLEDTSDTDFDSGSASLSITTGPAPGVTSSSTLDEGVTVQNFTASASDFSQLVVETNDDAFTAEFTSTDGEDTYLTLDETSDELVDSTSGDGVVTLNVTHDLLQDVPIEPGGSTDVQVTLSNESSTATNEFTFTLSAPADSGRTVKFVGESFADGVDVEEYDASNGTVTILDRSFSLPGLDNRASFIQQDVTATNTSTISFAFGNQLASDAAQASVEQADDEEWVTSSVVVARTDDGIEPIKVYANSAPTDLDADESYAVQDSETGRLTVYFGDDIDAEDDSVDLFVASNAGLLTQFNQYGVLDVAGSFGGMTIGLGGVSGLSLGLLILFGRPEPEVSA